MIEADRDAAVCYPPIEAAEIQRMRQKSNLSQAAFAHLLITHKRTIQRWEAGKMRPTGPSLALLNVIRRKGIEALL